MYVFVHLSCHTHRHTTSEWQWHQLGHMQICTLTQTRLHLHPTTQLFTGWMPFLPPNQQHQSTECKLSHHIQIIWTNLTFIVVGQHYCWCSGIIKEDRRISDDKTR